MQNSLFNLAWPIFDCLDPVPNLYKRKINLSWQSALSRIACPQVQRVKCGRKCPKKWIKEARKVLNTQPFIGLSVDVKHDLSLRIWVVVLVSPDLIMTLKALFSTGFKKKEKKHTASWKCQQQWWLGVTRLWRLKGFMWIVRRPLRCYF